MYLAFKHLSLKFQKTFFPLIHVSNRLVKFYDDICKL